MSDQGFAGWIGEPPDAEAPGGFADFLLQQRADPGEGRSVAEVLSRAARPDRPPEPYDDDERQAVMVARGYRPGLVSRLSQRLGDTMAELAAEQDKIEKGRRRQEHMRRAHAAGQVDAFGIARAQDFDEGDPSRVAQLERRVETLRHQLEEAQGMVAPPQRHDLDPVESASRRAHETFREVTRQRMAEARAGDSPPRARRPFVSRAFGDGHFDVPDCEDCVAAGATAEESFLLHSDPALGAPVTAPAEQAQRAVVDRLMRLGYSWETAQLAARPGGEITRAGALARR